MTYRHFNQKMVCVCEFHVGDPPEKVIKFLTLVSVPFPLTPAQFHLLPILSFVLGTGSLLNPGACDTVGTIPGCCSVLSHTAIPIYGACICLMLIDPSACPSLWDQQRVSAHRPELLYLGAASLWAYQHVTLPHTSSTACLLSMSLSLQTKGSLYGCPDCFYFELIGHIV